MNEPHQSVSQVLRRAAETHLQHPKPLEAPPPSEEDIEDSQHFNELANKNDSKTLTTGEAVEIMELLEEEEVIIIDTDGSRYVDYA